MYLPNKQNLVLKAIEIPFSMIENQYDNLYMFKVTYYSEYYLNTKTNESFKILLNNQGGRM